MPVYELTNNVVFTLPPSVKTVKLETVSQTANVVSYIKDTLLNYKMTSTASGATFVLANQTIQTIAGAGGTGTGAQGTAGQTAALSDLTGKAFAYVNDTSGTVRTDIPYDENHPIFNMTATGHLEMPFGYRIDPSAARAVWPYLGFTTTYVTIVADQTIDAQGTFTLTNGNNKVTWNQMTIGIPVGNYTLNALLLRLQTIFQNTGERGFTATYFIDKVQLYAPFSIRLTNETGSVWALLGFTKLIFKPAGPQAVRGQTIPLKLINEGLSAPDFPTDITKLWYTAKSASTDSGIIDLLGDDGTDVYHYRYRPSGTWLKDKRIHLSNRVIFSSISSNPLSVDTTDSPFLFSTSGSNTFSSLPNQQSVMTQGPPYPLILKTGATPFFTIEMWVKFTNDPQAANEIVMANNTFAVFRQALTGRLGFRFASSEGGTGAAWIGTTPLSKNTWHHIAVVGTPRNTVTAILATNINQNPCSLLGVQKGMVCAGPGIKDYALLTGTAGNLIFNVDAAAASDSVFTFAATGINLYTDGLPQILSTDGGLIDWTTITTPTSHLNIGIQKALLTFKDRIPEVYGVTVFNNGYTYILQTGTIFIYKEVTLQATIPLPNATGLHFNGNGMYAYVSTENKIHVFTVNTSGMLHQVPTNSTTDLGTPINAMAVGSRYIHVTGNDVIKTYAMSASDGTLTYRAQGLLANAGKIQLNPANTFVYVETGTTLNKYTLNPDNGALALTLAIPFASINAFYVTDSFVYVTGSNQVYVYTTMANTLVQTLPLVNANKIAVDATGRVYVSLASAIVPYMPSSLTGELIPGESIVSEPATGLVAEGTYVYVTSLNGNTDRYTGNANTNGKLSNVRISKAPLYDGMFVPSIIPLRGEISTTLLIRQDTLATQNAMEDELIDFYTVASPVLNSNDLFFSAPVGPGTFTVSYVYTTTEDTVLTLMPPSPNGVEFSFALPASATSGQGVLILPMAASSIPFTTTGGGTLLNIKLKTIDTAQLGKGGVFESYAIGGQGLTGGFSAGPLQPGGSGGGSSYGPGALSTIGSNTAGSPAGATLTYLNPLTRINTTNDYTSFPATLPGAWRATDLVPGTHDIITYGQKVFLLGTKGTSDLVMYDGRTWRPKTTGDTILWQGLAYSADLNLFIGVASSGDVWLNADIKKNAWHLKYASGIALTGVSIVYAHTGFVIMASSHLAVIRSNRNATQWSLVANAFLGLGLGTGYNSFVYNDGLILGTHPGGGVIKSTNGGLRWTDDTPRTGIAGASIGIVYGHLGFKILTSTGFVYTKTALTDAAWIRDPNPILPTVTAIAYGGGKYMASTATAYALGNAWQVFAGSGGDTIGTGIVFGNGQFVSVKGYTLGEYDTAMYSAMRDDALNVHITQETPEGLKTITVVPVEPGLDYVRINNADLIPLTSAGLMSGMTNGQPQFRSGTFDFPSSTYRKVQVELGGASGGGGSVTDAGGLGALAVMRGAVLTNTIYISLGMTGTGEGPFYPGGGGTLCTTQAVQPGQPAPAQPAPPAPAQPAPPAPAPPVPAQPVQPPATEEVNLVAVGFLVAGGGGGAGSNGSGGNAAENTGQKGQDGMGSPNTGGTDATPGGGSSSVRGGAKINLAATSAFTALTGGPINSTFASGLLPGTGGNAGVRGGGGGGGGVTGGGGGDSGGGGGGGGSGTEGIIYLAVSYETRKMDDVHAPTTGFFRVTVLPELTIDSERTDATILYLIQPDLPANYAYNRTLSYVVNINAQSNVSIFGRTAELETLSEFLGVAQYETVVIIEEGSKNTHIFGKTPPICFQKGTGILTDTGGYKPVEDLTPGCLVMTSQGEVVPVIDQVRFTASHATCPLFCLKANTLSTGLPAKDLYLSHNHAFKYQGHWHHMKCSAQTHAINNTDTVYYHLYLSDYFRYTLIAEGVEVESAFKETRYERMGWLCEEIECIPLKCIPFTFGKSEKK